MKRGGSWVTSRIIKRASILYKTVSAGPALGSVRLSQAEETMASGTKIMAHPVVCAGSDVLENSPRGTVGGGHDIQQGISTSKIIHVDGSTRSRISSSVLLPRILIIGATGYIGGFVAKSSVAAGHATYALIRPTTAAESAKAQHIQSLRDAGAHIVYGCVQDHNSMVAAMKEVDVVISVLGGSGILDQLKIIDAIKEVGTIKRFIPSEFGHDIDKANPVEPGLTFYNNKRKIRRAVEAANIPYTYICCNSIAGWPYFYHTHPSELPPPQNQFEIYGDGNIKAYFVTGSDIGAYTIKAVNDIRTLNKTVHFRPSKNFLTQNELAAIWEEKIGKTLPRVCISEQDLLAVAKVNIIPVSIVAALTHDIFINGCQYKFQIDGPHDVEVCVLYPDFTYTTVDHFFDEYL